MNNNLFRNQKKRKSHLVVRIESLLEKKLLHQVWFLFIRQTHYVIARGGRASGQADGWAVSSSLWGAYLQNYTSYSYEISSRGSAVSMNLNLCLLDFRVIVPCLISYLNFVWCTSPKLY